MSPSGSSLSGGWESVLDALLARSERRAWRVAVAAGGIALMAFASLAALTPLKVAIPYVIEVDRLTGEMEVVRLADPRSVTLQSVADRFWVTEYVRSRERYNWNLLQYDYDRVVSFSSAPLAREYSRVFEGADALDRRLGPSAELTVNVLSVTLPPGESGKAVVRFERVFRATEHAPRTVTRWIATLAYRYEPKLMARERELVTNPMGFQVIAYAVDEELAERTPGSAHDAAPGTPAGPGMIGVAGLSKP